MTVRSIASVVLLAASLTPALSVAQSSCDDAPRAEGEVICDSLVDEFKAAVRCDDLVHRTPAMIGDFFSGGSARLSGASIVDRLRVVADDLDASNPLPAAGSTLTITEPGPVGIFRTSLGSIQEIQSLLRGGSPLPAATLQGTIGDNATLATSLTVGQIQALLGSTAQGYDIIGLDPPPGTYLTAVDGVFASQNSVNGTSVLNSDGSGAVLQGGLDTLNGGEDFDAFYFYDYQVALDLLVPQISGGGVGRMKMAEGGSVLPQDRVYFRFSYIDDVVYRTNGVGLSRFTPGFEKTFGDGLFSFEMRTPFASNTVVDVNSDGGRSFGSATSEFGNMTMYLKALLLSSSNGALTGGLGIELPTADGVSVSLAGTPLLEVANDSVHLQPFLGMLHYHGEKLFSHGFVQFDFATSGNDVRINPNGAGLRSVGRFANRNNVFIDYGIGYWLYRGHQATGLTGVIPTFEVHHTNSISDGTPVTAGAISLASGSISVTNFVAGTTLEFGKNSNLTVAYGDSLDGSDLRRGAFRMMLSHRR